MVESLIAKFSADSESQILGYGDLITAEIINVLSKSMRLYDNAIAVSIKSKVTQLHLTIL